MSIQNELNQIKNAVYGADVRDAIHDSIKKAYDDASANGNANMEVELARGTEPTLNDRLGKMDDKDAEVTAQLANKAEQTELEAVSANVSNIIANNGDGTKDSEVVALRTDNKGNVYTAAPDRVNAIENDIDSKVTEPPIIRSVPVIQDNLNLETGVFTQHVEEIEISGSMFTGIITDYSNYDYIYTTIIPDAKAPDSSLNYGYSVLIDKNGNVLEQTTNSNRESDIGKYTYNVNPRLWIYVPKGAYGTIEEARADLGTMTLRYQLENPVVTTQSVGTITKELIQIRQDTSGYVHSVASKRVDKIETEVINFTRYDKPSRIQPPELKSVPSYSDSYIGFDLTRRIGERTLSGSNFVGIVTGHANNDYVFTIVIDGAKAGTGAVSGQTELKDKNGQIMTEGTNVDTESNAGKYVQNTNGRLWIYVPKGTYADIAAARADLGTMRLKYLLHEPRVETIETGFVLDLKEKRDFSIEVTNSEETPLNFKNIPTESNTIIAVSLKIINPVVANLNFPSGTLWRNNTSPDFAIGKTHMLSFVSYDNGQTWLASVIGEW